MAILTLFKSNQLSSNYIFRSGKIANFVRGRYATDVQSEIDELTAEVKLNHPHIYQDAKEITIDTEKLDPLFAIKKNLADQIRKEIMEEMAISAANKDRDMGTYESKNLNPASTTDIAPVAAGAGPNSPAGLAALLAKNKAAALTQAAQSEKAE